MGQFVWHLDVRHATGPTLFKMREYRVCGGLNWAFCCVRVCAYAYLQVSPPRRALIGFNYKIHLSNKLTK